MQGLEEKAGELTTAMLDMPNINSLLINILILCIVPALGEEFLFRGLIQRLLGSWMKNMHVAIVISAFMFSAYHMQFYGFVPRMLLGILMGYLFYWSGSLWAAVIAHSLFNSVQIIGYYLYEHNLFETNIEALETFPWYTTLISSILLLLLLIGFYRQNKIKRFNGERLESGIYDQE